MDLTTSYEGEPVYPTKRQRFVRCMKLIPWSVLIVAAGFAVGLAFWVGGAIQARDATAAFANAIGVRSDASSWLYNTVTTVVAAITIGGAVIVGVALLLSLVGTVERGLLLGACGGGSDSKAPPPWVFRGYQVSAFLLNTVVALLMLACVTITAAMLIWWGGFATVKAAIAGGVANAEVVLPTGATLSAASELTARVVSLLKSTDSSLASLLGAGGGLPFTPVCAPVCLNAGSFAFVLRMRDSCICGSAVIDAVRTAAARGEAGAGVGLAGAAAMWVATCLLLVILAGHTVTAGFDRRSAVWLKEQRAERAAQGFVANPKDCVPAGPSADFDGFGGGLGGAGGVRDQQQGGGGVRRLSSGAGHWP